MRLLRLKSSRLNRVFLPSLDSLPARLLPNPRYYRWVIVGFGMLCSLLSSPGQSFVLSLHLGPLMRDAGLSRVGVSTLYAAATLAAAAVLPLLGTLADRLTARRYAGFVLVGVGLVTGLLGLANGAVTVAAPSSGFASSDRARSASGR